MVTKIIQNIERIRAEIALAAEHAGRAASDVKLMGVTKFHPIEMMVEAASYLDLIGESRVQEAVGKRMAWKAGPSCPWHMIGHLQRNKVRRALATFDLIESIDKLETASAVSRVMSEDEENVRKYPIFVEVNMSHEAAKSGADPSDVERMLEAIIKDCPNVAVEGLMTIASDTDDEKLLHETFAGLRALRDRLRAATGLALSELSMGMSGDYKIAIEEGSTIVRIGSAIFGPRDY